MDTFNIFRCVRYVVLAIYFAWFYILISTQWQWGQCSIILNEYHVENNTFILNVLIIFF